MWCYRCLPRVEYRLAYALGSVSTDNLFCARSEYSLAYHSSLSIAETTVYVFA